MGSRLAGKTAFLTAAAQGIGRATAEAFVREGASVIATDIDGGLAELARECRLHHAPARRAPMPTPIAAGRARGRRREVLFNGAGFVHAGSVLECTEADWDLAFDLNVRSMCRTIRAFLPGMLAQRRRARSSTSPRSPAASRACRTASSTARARPR